MAGVAQAEVARRLGVSRQSVSRWEKAREQGGTEAVRAPQRFGRPRRLSEAQCAQLARERNERAIRTGKARRWPQLKKSRRDEAE